KNASSAVTRFRRSDFMDATIAFCLVLANFGIAMAARMPMITTTINNSMSVKPLRRIYDLFRVTVRVQFPRDFRGRGVALLVRSRTLQPCPARAIESQTANQPPSSDCHRAQSIWRWCPKTDSGSFDQGLEREGRRIAPPPLGVPVPSDLTSRPGRLPESRPRSAHSPPGR